MKNVKKTISLIIIIAMLLNVTACSSLKETFSSSKASASDITAESIINDATIKAQQIDKFESANVNVDFSFTPSSDNAIKGNIQLDAFLADMKAQLSTKLTKNDSTIENISYLDQTNLLFSLDGKNYSKFDLTKITSLSPKINTILNVIKSLNSTNSKTDMTNMKDVKFKSDASNNQGSTASGSVNGIDFQSLLEKFLSSSNILALDGTKTIDGHEMYVLKASVNNQKINSFLNTYKDSLDIPDDMSNKLKSSNGIDAELYLSATNENVVGFKANLSNILSTSSDEKSSENNYIQVLFGINSGKEFQLPNANALSIKDINSLISKIPSLLNKYSIDTTKLSNDYSKLSNNGKVYKGFDIRSIFENFDINDILDKIDFKKILLEIIKSIITG